MTEAQLCLQNTLERQQSKAAEKIRQDSKHRSRAGLSFEKGLLFE